jgi:hypothetical protein
MPFSGILRRVALVRTDVSEELSASFIRVTIIGELGTRLAVTSNRRPERASTCEDRERSTKTTFRHWNIFRLQVSGERYLLNKTTFRKRDQFPSSGDGRDRSTYHLKYALDGALLTERESSAVCPCEV